jgi:phospholipid:diacylglycerol acyltransferase
MIKAIITSQSTWIKAMSLDPDTGLDRENYRTRSVQGIEAASSFMPGFWLWSKIIENLAVLDYSTDLSMAAYDWRLSFYK